MRPQIEQDWGWDKLWQNQTVPTQGEAAGYSCQGQEDLPDQRLGVGDKHCLQKPHDTDKMISKREGRVGEKRSSRPDWYFSLTILTQIRQRRMSHDSLTWWGASSHKLTDAGIWDQMRFQQTLDPEDSGGRGASRGELGEREEQQDPEYFASNWEGYNLVTKFQWTCFHSFFLLQDVVLVRPFLDN